RVDQYGRYRGFRGLDNYLALFSDGAFLAALNRTLVWTIAVVVITTILSIALAIILNRPFRGRAVARGLLLLPWATGLVVVGLLWRWMAQPDFGALNHLLASVGYDVRVEWLANPTLSFPLMIGIAIWASVPPTTLILMAGLQTIDRDFYEAAAIDGARGVRVFWDFTLPLLRPVLAVSVLLNVVFVFNSFPIIWTMTEGGPAGATDTLVTHLYRQGFRLYNVGGAAAISMVIFVILLAFAIVHTKLTWRNVLR
ncbi:MAG: sugar ABC transporter permease, partial [Desulfobacterales bacterium]|nr:sugar ABC transporter permease [Desulfobacterales bacterium]